MVWVGAEELAGPVQAVDGSVLQKTSNRQSLLAAHEPPLVPEKRQQLVRIEHDDVAVDHSFAEGILSIRHLRSMQILS